MTAKLLTIGFTIFLFIVAYREYKKSMVLKTINRKVDCETYISLHDNIDTFINTLLFYMRENKPSNRNDIKSHTKPNARSVKANTSSQRGTALQ